jgi:hypothetical protein
LPYKVRWITRELLQQNEPVFYPGFFKSSLRYCIAVLTDLRQKLEKVDLVITDTPAFQILNEAMKGMKHVVIYLTTY